MWVKHNQQLSFLLPVNGVPFNGARFTSVKICNPKLEVLVRTPSGVVRSVPIRELRFDSEAVYQRR